MIVTVVCFSRNVVDLLPMIKTARAEVTAKALFSKRTILHPLPLGIETAEISRQTTGSVLRTNVLLVCYQPETQFELR